MENEMGILIWENDGKAGVGKWDLFHITFKDWLEIHPQ